MKFCTKAIWLISSLLYIANSYANEPYVGFIAGTNSSFDLKNSKIDTSFGYYIGAHIGYKFYRHFRLEEEFVYQQANIHSFEIQQIRFNHVKGQVNVWSLMTNIIFDLNLPFFMSPYLGGGIGYADANGHWQGYWIQMKRNFLFEYGHRKEQKIHKNDFAWQFILGLKVLTYLGLEANFEYRYFRVENHLSNHRLGIALIKFF